jgi:hypothetical protein
MKIQPSHKLKWLEIVNGMVGRNHAAFRVAWLLLNGRNSETGVYIDSFQGIGERLGVSDDTAERAAKYLKKLKVTRVKTGRYKRAANQYSIGLPDEKGEFQEIQYTHVCGSNTRNHAPQYPQICPPNTRTDAGHTRKGIRGGAAYADAPLPPVSGTKPKRPNPFQRIPLDRIRWHLNHGFEVPQEIIDDVDPEFRHLIPKEALAND